MVEMFSPLTLQEIKPNGPNTMFFNTGVKSKRRVCKSEMMFGESDCDSDTEWQTDSVVSQMEDVIDVQSEQTTCLRFLRN